MQTVGHWLGKLGFTAVRVGLRAQAVDFDLLCELTDEDLEKVGVHLRTARSSARPSPS